VVPSSIAFRAKSKGFNDELPGRQHALIWTCAASLISIAACPNVGVQSSHNRWKPYGNAIIEALEVLDVIQVRPL
jgi:hypothetical protein